MNSTSSYISLMLISVGIVMIASIVLVNIPTMENNLIIGKRCWFHLSLIFLSASTLFAALFHNEKIHFNFSLSDAFILFLLLSCGIIYQWDLTKEPDKFALGLQLTLLWFMLRISLSIFPELSAFIMSIILCIGSVEALLGIIQFFNLTQNGHFLSQLTGSFVNATSYGGYLAVLLPVSLCWVLRYGSCRKAQWWRIRTLLFYVALPALILIMTILPVVIDFTTWLAAVIPCMWIAWRCLTWGHLLKRMKLRHSVAFTYASIFMMVAIFLTVSGSYVSKMYTGNIQLFQYRPTFNLHPKTTLMNAGFSEFTNLTMPNSLPYGNTEINILILLLFIIFQITCFFLAYKRGLIDVCGAILAACIFMVFSFSLIRPPFLITLTLIAALSNLRSSSRPVKIHLSGKLYTIYHSQWNPASIQLGRNGIILFSILLLTATHSIFFLQKDTYQHYQQWMQQTAEIKNEWRIPLDKQQ